MHRAAHVIPAPIFIDGSANSATNERSGSIRAMAINHMNRMMRARSLAIMVAGTLCLFVTIAPAAQGQAVPRQLPPEPAPELPSVSDYSLPPGENQTPANDQAEGPVEENALPPQAAPTTNIVAPGAQPAARPVPVAPGAAPAIRAQDRPAAVANTRPSAPVNPAPRVTTTRPPAGNTATAVPASDDPAPSENQPQPGFSTELPGQTLPSASDASPDTMQSPVTAEASSNTNFRYYVGGGILFLLLAGLGTYFWRHKSDALLYEGEITDDSGSVPVVDPAPAQTPRKPAPKIYSPPNPAAPKKPSPVMSNGFVTSKIGVTPEPKAQPKATRIQPTAPNPPKPNIAWDSASAEHLQIAFIANGASSTLLNAVLNYTVTLTNTSKQNLHQIRLSGTMTQADAESAKNAAAQISNLLHNAESLSAGETLTLTGDIRLPLNAIRPITFKSQALFIPLARFDAEFTDNEGTVHKQSVSFIVGREYEPPRPKMAPFRLDLGPRSFDPVGQRPLITS